MKKYGKFAALVILIVGTLIWIATSSMADTQTYYKTIAELGKMGSRSMEQKVRVGGDVKKGSIQHDGEIVDFTMVQADPAKPEQAPLYLKVVYSGRDPLPDTFPRRRASVGRWQDGCGWRVPREQDPGKMRVQIRDEARTGSRGTATGKILRHVTSRARAQDLV